MIHKVAIIGAGPAGVTTAKHLLSEKHFSTIDVFEQQASTGGVWNYTPYAPFGELSIPQTNPQQPLQEPHWERERSEHGDQIWARSNPIFVTPMYDRLESNIPHFLMEHSDDASLEKEQLFAGRESVLRYLNNYADDVRHLIKFKTQVYDIKKLETDKGTDRWLVCARNLVTNKVVEDTYDAVAVASGHHYVPVVPNIPGIEVWNETYPNTITHSKYYRCPDSFANKKVIVVGNSASGLDIGTQIGTVSKHPLLNSQRSAAPEFHRPASWKKEMPEIVEFVSPSEVPRAVRSADGQIESDIDAIVFCTGYYYSFPFLSTLQPPITSTGERVENLYKQLFSIAHPTLAFIGLPYKIVPFRTYEGQAAVVARVWSSCLSLPSGPEMRAWEAQRIAEKGAGKKFHELTNLEDFRYHNDLVEWALQATPQEAERRVPPKWSREEEVSRKNIPGMKEAFAELGEERHVVRRLEDLHFTLRE
ncbi:MAG: hypothetical protein Q9207_000474 [Kuettlingeria erythrocarpa]